jgi:AAA domain-containing protein
MLRYYLSQISIEGFRGINNDGDPLVIKFKPNAVNSIHAHNGVGKTSIFEAIHFAIFGTMPRLTRLQGAEHPEEYIMNRFHPAGEAAVTRITSSPPFSTSVLNFIAEFLPVAMVGSRPSEISLSDAARGSIVGATVSSL